jgi:hypothetical protein
MNKEKGKSVVRWGAYYRSTQGGGPVRWRRTPSVDVDRPPACDEERDEQVGWLAAGAAAGGRRPPARGSGGGQASSTERRARTAGQGEAGGDGGSTAVDLGGTTTDARYQND